MQLSLSQKSRGQSDTLHTSNGVPVCNIARLSKKDDDFFWSEELTIGETFTEKRRVKMALPLEKCQCQVNFPRRRRIMEMIERIKVVRISWVFLKDKIFFIVRIFLFYLH